MAFTLTKKEFKHNDCDELNKELDEFISDLSFQLEGVTDNFMDVVLDHQNQKEKEWEELYESPLDWLESILLKTQKDVLEEVVDKLEELVYTEKPKYTPRLKGKDAMNWAIDDVKPLILKDITKRKDVAELCGVSEKCVRDRLRSAYYCGWKEYVDGVQHGRY